MEDAAKPTLPERISAAMYDPALWWGEKRGMAARRARVLSQARGSVLEIGAGTGLNLSRYGPEVERLILLEPMPGMAARLARRVEESGREAEVLNASAEEIPLADDSVDTVVSTLVLCTVPDPDAAIREIGRVLRPDGRFLFVEHVRSDNPKLARWQDRLHKPWAAIGEGCQCNRDTLALIQRHLRTSQVDKERWRGMPPLVRPLILGEAHPAA